MGTFTLNELPVMSMALGSSGVMTGVAPRSTTCPEPLGNTTTTESKMMFDRPRLAKLAVLAPAPRSTPHTYRPPGVVPIAPFNVADNTRLEPCSVASVDRTSKSFAPGGPLNVGRKSPAASVVVVARALEAKTAAAQSARARAFMFPSGGVVSRVTCGSTIHATRHPGCDRRALRLTATHSRPEGPLQNRQRNPPPSRSRNDSLILRRLKGMKSLGDKLRGGSS